MVLSFAAGRNFAADRLYATLEKAFGVAPAAYFNGFWVNGVVLVEGEGRNTKLPGLIDASAELQKQTPNTIVATDQWPFLYLTEKSIPGPILATAGLFLLGTWLILRKTHRLAWKSSPWHLHFFCLGAGFLLLETKAVTELSLLFGSTWLVNSLVIASFLLMALLSNVLASLLHISEKACYRLLFFLLLLLLVDFRFPYWLLNSASPGARFLIGGMWTALPVFFSGLVFSSNLKKFGRPAEVLGINLFGAVIGGILENMVMIGGTPVLGALAIFLYSASAMALWRASQSSKTYAVAAAVSS